VSRQKFQQGSFAFAAMGNVVGALQVRAGIFGIGPAILRTWVGSTLFFDSRALSGWFLRREFAKSRSLTRRNRGFGMTAA